VRHVLHQSLAQPADAAIPRRGNPGGPTRSHWPPRDPAPRPTPQKRPQRRAASRPTPRSRAPDPPQPPTSAAQGSRSVRSTRPHQHAGLPPPHQPNRTYVRL
jgi:hypothetical protein